jgi:hypothetical protein
MTDEEVLPAPSSNGRGTGESVLKGLITERTIVIEQKGIDPVQWPNRLKLMMAANAEWVVPASFDERLKLWRGRRRVAGRHYRELAQPTQLEEIPKQLLRAGKQTAACRRGSAAAALLDQSGQKRT